MIFEQEKLVNRTDMLFDGYGKHGMLDRRLVVGIGNLVGKKSVYGSSSHDHYEDCAYKARFDLTNNKLHRKKSW